MPVYIWQKDAFKKFVQVESLGNKDVARDIIRHQKTFNSVSFWAFLQKWHELYAQYPNIVHMQRRHIETAIEAPDGRFLGNDVVIYGHGGWNRWLVYNTGEMMLHRLMAPCQEYIGAAKLLGFRIFPDAIQMVQLSWPW